MNKSIKSRREFIRNMAIGGSAVFLAASPWLNIFGEESNAGKSAGNRIRLAFIGTGSRGKELLRNLLPVLEECNIFLQALCDNYQPHLKDTLDICAQKNIHPVTYNDYRRLLDKEKIDAVIIATPLNEHAHIVIDCLQAGIHVFCEKALARTTDDVKRMYDTHIQTGKILQTGHQRLFNPIYLSGMQRIHNGELGKIGQIRAYWHRNGNWRRPLPDNNQALDKQINWRLYKDVSAGLLTELMSHQIHVANWALDAFPVSVMGTGSTVFWKDGRTVPDNIALIFTYPGDVQFVYDSMTSNKKYGLEEQIMGDKGTIEFEVNRYYTENPPAAPGIRMLINDLEHGVFDHIGVGGSSWVPETAVTYAGEKILTEDSGNDTQLQLIAFAGFIRKGKAPEKMIKEAYYGSIWTLLAETAIDTGRKVVIPEKYII
jgi:predicted dehydrogenase